MKPLVTYRAVVFFAFLSSAVCGLRGQTAAAPNSALTMWYSEPAEKWTDALPLGNGRVAAIVFGGVQREHLQLNEDTLTSGEPPADLRSLDITKDFDQVTAMIRAGKNAEADAYVTKHWL